MLNWVVQRAVQAGVDQAMSEWRQRFAMLYQEWSLRGLVPEEAFGQVDRGHAAARSGGRINHLEEFLRPRQNVPFAGPVLLGESIMPIGARERFPALTLPLTRKLPRQAQGEARLVGSVMQAWRGEAEVDVLVWCLANYRRGQGDDALSFRTRPVLPGPDRLG